MLSFTFFVINAVSLFSLSISIFLSSLCIRPNQRILHYLCFHITSIASVAYMGLASDVGVLTLENGKSINIIRYVDWMLTTPAQIVLLSRITQLDSINTCILCLLDELMMITGIIAEWTSKSIFAILSTIYFVPILFFMMEDLGHQSMTVYTNIGDRKLHHWMSRILLSLWIVYPFIFGLHWFEYLNDDTENISYAILDFMGKIVMTLVIMNIAYREKIVDSISSDGSPNEAERVWQNV